MRIRLIASSIALSFLLAAFAAFVTPICALAIDENPSGSVLDVVGNGEVVTVNNGEVATNRGTITTNNGTIVNNYSQVPTNNGTIVNNFSVNVGTTATGLGAKIVNNYMGGYESGRLRGENNFYRISSSDYPGLDWSRNPESFTTPQYLYIGDSRNSEGLRGAIFKAKDGYEISLKGTAGTGFTLTDNQNGTYSITVTDSSIMDVDLGSAIELKATVMLDVKATPSEGGAVCMNGAPFQPGYYDPRGQYTFSAVANEGYKFVGWESGDNGPHVRVELDGDRATVSIWHDEGRAFTVGLTAKFEKTNSGNDSGGGSSGASDPESAGGSGTQSSSQSTLAQAGDDSRAGLLTCAAAVSLAVLVATGVSLRVRLSG